MKRPGTWLALSVLLLGTTPGIAAAADSCGIPPGLLRVSDLPDHVNVVVCNLVGRAVTDRGMLLRIPSPGEGVGTEELYIDGSDMFQIETSADGVVTFTYAGSDVQQTAGGGGSGPNPCTDTAHNDNDFHEDDLFEWGFRESTTPSELTEAAAEDAIRDAIVNITHEQDDCGELLAPPVDGVWATSNFLAGLNDSLNMTADGSQCTSRDGNNMVAFGDLPLGASGRPLLGKACWWDFPLPGLNDLVNADVRLNKQEHLWAAGSTCISGRFDVEAVMTHEWGHVFGLAHVAESTHSRLTMSESVGSCDTTPRSLGAGDVIGLRSLYS